MWQRKTDGERISPHTIAHTAKRGLGSVKQKGSICFSALCASRKRQKEDPCIDIFTSIHRIVEEQRWRSSPLDKLTCSAGKYSCLALLPRLPSSQTPPGAKSHSSIFSARGIHHAERLILLLLHQKYYPAWTSDPYTVSLGDDGIHMGPIIFFLSVVDFYLCRKTLP